MNRKKMSSPKDLNFFLYVPCSVNSHSICQKKMGVFGVTFLATELRVRGYFVCLLANKIGNVPCQQ